MSKKPSAKPEPVLSKAAYVWIGVIAITAAAVAGISQDWTSISKSSKAGTQITVYRDPSCDCCHHWIEYLETKGFAVDDVPARDLAPVRKDAGVPERLAACHTAVVGGYVIEGHVPAEDIRRLLKEHPQARGLAVPGMPGTSPGMEKYGDPHDAYDVMLFFADGHAQVFAHHEPPSASAPAKAS